MKFSYFPGCTLKTKARDLDKWGRESALKLGVELREIEEWQCCGAVYPHRQYSGKCPAAQVLSYGAKSRYSGPS